MVSSLSSTLNEVVDCLGKGKWLLVVALDGLGRGWGRISWCAFTTHAGSFVCNPSTPYMHRWAFTGLRRCPPSLGMFPWIQGQCSLATISTFHFCLPDSSWVSPIK